MHETIASIQKDLYWRFERKTASQSTLSTCDAKAVWVAISSYKAININEIDYTLTLKSDKHGLGLLPLQHAFIVFPITIEKLSFSYDFKLR